MPAGPRRPIARLRRLLDRQPDRPGRGAADARGTSVGAGLPVSSSAARRSATLAAPVAVPLTMTAVFALLRRRLPRRAAYAAGFAVYWAGWCAAFPLWVLRPHGVRRALRSGRRSGPV